MTEFLVCCIAILTSIIIVGIVYIDRLITRDKIKNKLIEKITKLISE